MAADFDAPRLLERALQGVSTALVVTNRVGGDDDLRLIRAAGAVGVRRLVKLSAAAVLDPDADDLITRWQRTTEELLCASGLEWTLLRPRAFMSNTLSWAASIRSERVVRALHGTSANACVDPRDIGEVAARVLTEEGHAGKAYTLTGPEPITPAEQTEQLRAGDRGALAVRGVDARTGPRGSGRTVSGADGRGTAGICAETAGRGEIRGGRHGAFSDRPPRAHFPEVGS